MAQEIAQEVDTKECPHCFTKIDTRAKVCPNCAKNVKTAESSFKIGTFIMAAGLLMLIGGVFVDPIVIVLGLALMGVGAVLRLI